MKKLSKTLFAIAAVSAASMAMTASAMAMTATYADGTVTLNDVKATGDSQTLLIVNGEGVTVDSTNANKVVEQIDQKDDGTVFESAIVGELADGTYEVRIGGSDGSMQKITFTVGDAPSTTKDITIGDIDGMYGVDSDDLTALARALVSLKGEAYGNEEVGITYTVNSDGSTITIGDIDGMYGVDSDDLTALARALVSLQGEDYNNATVGQVVTVNIQPVVE